MKKKYLFIIIFYFISFHSFGQDCLERSLSDDVICIGQNASIILSNSEITMTYQLRIGASDIGSPITGTGSDITFTVSPSITTIYSVFATSNTASVCDITYADVSTVTVNNLSVAPTTISGITTICNGQSTTLTVNGGTLGTGAMAEWFSGSCNGIAVGTGNSITVSPISNTTYYVRYNGSCNVTSCASTAVIVNSVPVPTVSIGVSPGSNICAGTSVTFTANPTNGGTSPLYQWKINGTNIGSNSSTATFTSSSLVNTDKVTVVLTSNATCAAPVNATSNQITMTVNDLLTPSISISSSSTTICPGNNINFSAVAINGGSTPFYQWKINNSNVGINSPNFSSTTLIDGDVVTVELTSNAICVSPTKITSNSIPITVNPAIPTTPLAVSGISTQCPTLNNQAYTIAAVTNATIYNWTVPSGWTITGGQGTTSINVTTGNSGQNGNISVTAGNSCGTSSASNLAVTIIPNASIASVSGTNAICIGSTTTYSANSVILGGGTGAWSSSNTAVATVDSTTGLVTGIAAGNSNIIYTITGGCSGTKTAQQSITINPDANIASVTGTSPICISGTTTFTANSVTLGGGTGTWSSSNAAIATVNSSGLVTGIGAGNCNIVYTISGGCSGTKTAQQSITITPNASISSVTGTSPICIAGTTTYSANSIVLGGGTGAWSSSNTAVATVDSSTGIVTGIAAGTTNIIYSITGGCSGTKSAQQTLTITPNTSIGSVTGTSPICISGTTTYAANSVVLGGGTGAWSSSNTAVATINSSTGVVTGVSAGTSNIIYTISGGCSGIKTAQQSITITPNASISSVTGASPICISGTTTYAANSVVLGGGSGTWTSSNTAVATVNSSTGVVTGVSAGTSNIIYTISGGCSGTKTAQQSITVNPNASIASVTGISNLCISTSTSFTANSVILGGGTGTWSSSNNSVATVNATGLVTATGAGTCNITYTITGGCGGNVSASQPINVFSGIPATPGIPIVPVGQSSSLCPIAYGLMYSISAVANATSYTWNVPAGWTITSGQGTTAIVVDAGVQSTGTKNISVTATNACGSSTSPNYSATVGTFGYVDAGVDQIVCAGTSTVSLLATGGGSTNINNDLTWSAPSGSFSNTGKANATYTINNAIATSGGSVTLTATVRAEGSCPVSTDQMVITVLPPVTASIGGTTTICSGSTTNITFNATPNTTVTYTVTGIAGSSTINIGASGTAVLTTPTLSASKTYSLTSVAYTATPTCSLSATGNAIITVSQTPIVTAGGPDTVCQSSTPSAITLSGATRSGGATTAAWSITSGGGSLSSTAPTSNPASVTYTPAANYSGNVILTLTSDAPTACSPTSATRTITINASPTVNAGGPDIVCQSATPSALTLSGATIGGGATTAAWSITSGGGTLSSTAQTASPATVTYTPAANSSGVITLTLTTNALSSCSPISATRTITINAASSVNSGTNQTICQSATPSPITLAGASVGGGATTGAWSITSGGGTLSNTAQTASPATVTYTPAANYSGAVILTLTTNALSTCSTVSATKTITVNALSTVNPGLDQTICQSSSPSAITLTGASIGGGATTGAWSITSGGGTLSSTAQTATPSSVTYTPAINYSGNVILTLTTNSATSCNPTTATRTITINVASTVNPGLNQTICQSPSPSPIQLTGASFGGGATTAAWSITSGGGSLSNTAQTTTPDLVTYTPATNYSGNVILTLTTSALTSCTATNATRTITVNTAPTVNAGGPNIACQSLSPSSITLAGASIGGGATTGAWSITSGGGTLSSTAQTATPATVTYTPAINYSGNVILTLTTNALTSCSPISDTRTITVNTASTVDAGLDQTICQSATPSAIILTGAFIGGGATTGAWSITSGGGTLSNTAQNASPQTVTYTPASNFSGTVILKLTTNSATSCTTASATKTFTVKKEVIITTQPSNTSICASFPADLNVVAIGDELTYQWYKGAFPGVAVSNSGNISGAQSSNLHFNQASLSDDGIYYVIVSGASACSPVISAQRTLNVDQAIIVSNQPITQSICSGSNITLTVSADANGDMLSFQWRKNGTNIGAPTTSTTNSSLILNNNTITATYDVLISGPSGYTCSSVQSTTATVTIYPIPTISGTLSVCEGANTQLSGSASPNVSSPWLSSNTAVATVSNTGLVTGILAGSTTITYTNSNGCKITATVTVNPTPNAVVTNGSQTICSSTLITPMVVSGNVPSTIFNWTRDNTGTVTGIAASGSGNISGNLVNTTSAPVTVTFTIIPSTATCIGIAITSTVVVNPTAQVNQPLDQILCNSSFITAVNFGTTNTGGTTTYSWTNNTTSIGLAASGSGNITSFSAINNGNSPVIATIIVTPTFTNGGASCIGATKTFTITVNPKANVNKPSPIDVCNGNTVAAITFGSSNSGGTKTYAWTNNNPSIGLGASGTGDIPSFTAINNGSSPITATINVTPTFDNGGIKCNGQAETFVITINPTAEVNQPSNLTFCNGNATSAITFGTTNTGGTTTYNWTNNTPSIGITSGSGSILSFSAINNGTTPVIATITVTPSFNNSSINCTGPSKTFTITVNPTPTVTVPSNLTVCNNGVVPATNFTSSPAGGTFTWTNSNPSIGLAASGAGNIPSFNATNSGTSAINATITVTPTVNGCTGTPKTYTIKIDASSTGGIVSYSDGTKTKTDCHSASGQLTLSGHTGTILYWETSIDAGNTWTNIANGGNTTYNYSTITTNTMFRVAIQNASCTIVKSDVAILFIIPNIKPSPVSALPSTICEGDSTTLTSSASYSTSQNLQNGGLFNTAQPVGWYVDGGNFNASGDNGNNHTWLETNGNAGTEYDTASNDKFAIVRGAIDSRLETPIFDLVGLTTANLTFDYAYQLASGATGKVELSFDGGATYPVTLITYTGNKTPYNKFTSAMSINLDAYLGYSNLRIKFNFHGTVNSVNAFGGSSWAIDNVKIPQAPVPTLTSQWQNLGTGAIISVSNATNVTVTPAITTTYAVTSFLNGCTSYGIDGTTYVTVTVNKRPLVTASPATICSDDISNIPLSSAVVGTETSTTFTWTVVQTGVTGATVGSGNTIAQKLTTTGATSGTAVYTITPTSKGCLGTAKNITVTVNPRPTANIGPNQTICYGGTGTFSIALTGKAPWTFTYTNGTTPTTVTTSANPYVFTVPNIIVNTTYIVTALSDANCNPAKPSDLTGSAAVTVLTGTAGIWTGLVSTDWFDCKNWEQGLPSYTIDAQIPTTPSGGFGMPVIDNTSPFAPLYSGIATARDLIVNPGASVTMVNTNNSELQISRNWRNSGAFIPGTGTVTFNGGTANQIQTINLGIKTNETFYNLKTNTTGTAKGLSVVNQFELTVQNQLNLLKGDVRLTGEAQLVQTIATSNPTGGQGVLLIDQQGQKNSFNYNYWSSPVSLNNINYSISSVLRDGTDVTTNPFNPTVITFLDGAFSADLPQTNPITVSNRWLWAFNSPALSDPLLNYYQWKYVGSTGTINIGEGFTMKGNGGVAPISSLQNYIFVGIPNTGTIQLKIDPEQSYLVGNPYPSALDAKQFIRDNLRDCTGCTNSKNVFNGALYYWDHFGLSNNHYLAEYEGGYATYTLMGGVAGINDSSLTVNDGSTGSKIPKQYIPVAQGFFVDAFLDTDISGSEIPISVEGGTLLFKNSQRQFVRESSGSSLFMKTNSTTKINSPEIDDRSKIRLGFDSAIGAHRQLLVGIDPNTTNQFDIGYDAPMYDLSDDDMYWEMNNTQFIIQGVPNFNDDQIIPVGINVANEGAITIKIDAMENIPNSLEIYLFDNVTGIYNDIKNNDLTLSLTPGAYTNRFSLHFANKTLSVDKAKLNDGILVYFTNDNKILNIKNNFVDNIIEKVYLFNILGQKIENWTIDDGVQASIKLPIKNVRTGVYIVKIQTSKGNFSKNIIVH
ncbi:Ig-like domain-containing protein [Flavobacterium sp. WC2429]|uniref:Ig-like domain-containing protein n=1 Tax=Flavobacterium sp. WC2429 TaxID=3234140 RepID=A0AB39WMF3_9FLAO